MAAPSASRPRIGRVHAFHEKHSRQRHLLRPPGPRQFTPTAYAAYSVIRTAQAVYVHVVREKIVHPRRNRRRVCARVRKGIQLGWVGSAAKWVPFPSRADARSAGRPTLGFAVFKSASRTRCGAHWRQRCRHLRAFFSRMSFALRGCRCVPAIIHNVNRAFRVVKMKLFKPVLMALRPQRERFCTDAATAQTSSPYFSAATETPLFFPTFPVANALGLVRAKGSPPVVPALLYHNGPIMAAFPEPLISSIGSHPPLQMERDDHEQRLQAIEKYM